MLEVLMFLDLFYVVHCDDNLNMTPSVPEALQIISPLSPLVPATCVNGGNLCENEASDKDCADVFAPPNTNVHP
ncbi:unnamed protein product [Gongylonema pulchrum]|uniref:Secreted protein n=1 Tax=Gongylonema pulchrum TaxID=637853 RepID=A0A183D750_9BILA|nr:unnamed protein product [Gongylonema pulchrum]